MQLTAMVTPFNDNATIDFFKFKDLVIRQRFCDGVVVAGTTGEGHSLEFKEKKTLVDIVDSLRERGALEPGFRIVLCVNGLDQVKKAQAIKARIELLLTPPIYYKPSQREIVDFYKLCASHSKFPIIVYNNPSRVGVDIGLEAMTQLLREHGIIGVKESSLDFRKVMELSRSYPDKVVMCGEDSHVGVFYACGARGWISVVGNILPELAQKLNESYLVRSVDEEAESKVLKVIDELSFAGNPVAVKGVLAELGLIKNVLRFPLSSVIIDATNIKSIVTLYEETTRRQGNSSRKSQSAL